ncbi:hypothetical protein [Caldibacillus thermoamylovorans]|uniref:hypothetical protein n=1 Tax=Caldibacillus thermoamylovorans TaxID=35841 RepID=UPI000A4574F4|nr:hypothetical protein [Caldibacillus thermoamylovorans]
MVTRLFLVTILSRETPFFGDEPFSRRYFWPENLIFWRRALFSSPFWGEKLDFLATKPLLVAILRQETHNFSDETYSRHHFEPGNSFFWRPNLFSSPI